MIELIDILPQRPEWPLLLGAYRKAESLAKSGDEKHGGWVPRVDELPGVDAELLSTLHGELIAADFLKFDLKDRELGLQYRLTTAGKRFLDSADVPEMEEVASDKPGSGSDSTQPPQAERPIVLAFAPTRLPALEGLAYAS